MLFVALLKATASTTNERIARRAQWQYPEGIRPVAEYWLQTADPTVIAIFETDSVAPIMATLAEWGDVFDISVVPAVTAEEGLQLAQQMMQDMWADWLQMAGLPVRDSKGALPFPIEISPLFAFPAALRILSIEAASSSVLISPS